MKDNLLTTVQSGGASIIYRSPLFSFDSKYMFCACGHGVNVYSTTTGKIVQKLIAHQQRVTGIAQHPKIKLQLLSTSTDGTLRIWDYEDGVLLKTIHVKSVLHGLFTHVRFADHVYVVQKEGNDHQLSRIPIKELESAKKVGSKLLVQNEVLLNDIKKPITKSVRFLSSGVHVLCRRKDSICVINTKQPKKKVIEHFNDADGYLTCLTCHPTDNCCVTGHSSGKIKFWHNIYPSISSKKDEKLKTSRVLTSTQHWHEKYVEDVCFTPGGSSLLSVGKEGVLVQWHYLESGNKKDFLPRLGAPMRHIVVSDDGSLYATTHMDNSILVISSVFNIQQTIEGFTASRQFSSAVRDDKESILLPCNLEYDWKTRSCVTNGKPGHLLFYQPYTDTQLYNLDIIHQNYIASDMSSNSKVSIITQVALSPETKGDYHAVTDAFTCTWMATIEDRNDEVTTREQRLKIWIFDETEQWWKLNTVVNDPHDSSVTSLVFRPNPGNRVLPPALLSTGLDGMAKIWMLNEPTGDEAPSWSCEAAASYRQHAVHSGDFSQDGSLAALAFENVVCLSNPDVLEDLTVFLLLPKERRIKRVLFGLHECQHILMILASDQMCACDLLTGDVLWSADVQVMQLIRDPISDVMAVFTIDRRLHIFRPAEPLPVYTHPSVTESPVLAAGFIPRVGNRESSWLSTDSGVEWMCQSRLFFITGKMTVHTLCTEADVENKYSKSEYSGTFAVSKDKLNTPLGSVLSKSSSTEESGQTHELETSTLSHSALQDALKQVIDTPSHVMPPISTLCQKFLSSLLIKKSNSMVASIDQEEVCDQIRSEDGGEMDEKFEFGPLPEGDWELDKITADSFKWAADSFRT